ncbi:MAG: hypothetical protein KAU48_11500 [Candidatus Thorarchaeota archaeon]|nr:hypothetical protein [Candidatus Thorarchaeota archaeon]
MKVQYKKWESGKGLEEIQATIYTEVSGLPARADEIGPRNDRRGKEATRYALAEDGKPLAYITSAISDSEPGRAHIGYPWSLPDCPEETKEKLFDDLMNHLYSTDGISQIRTGVVLNSKTKKNQIEYFKKRGFVESERYFRYNFDMDVKKTAKKKITGKASELKSKVATEEDISALVELCLADEHLRRAFPDEEAFTAYFKDRVLKDGQCVLLFDGDKLVSATAPLRMKPDGNFLTGDEERLIMRFVAARPGYTFAWDRLAVELAKACETAGMTDLPIRGGFGYRAQGAAAIGIANMQSNIEPFEIFYVHDREKT